MRKLVTTYKKDYDKIAFSVLSEKALRSKAHVCSVIGCTLSTLEGWINDQESFASNIESGLNEGEKLFRDKLAQLSLRPPQKHNTKLLLTLALDVYGIGNETKKSEVTIKTKAIDENISEDDAKTLYRELMQGGH